jgi:transposase
MTAPACFVGIDVAKATLEVATRPGGERWSVANDEDGIRALVNRLRPLAPTLIVLEATGGFEIATVAAAAAAGLPVVVANPRQVRDFARAAGQLAKPSMRRSWRSSPSGCAPSRGRCPTRRPRPSMPS